MDAAAVAAKHTSPRAATIRKFHAYVEGTQYEGRPPFLQEGDDAPPLLERAPCVVAPVVADAIRSHADFVLGEGRWPAIRPVAGALSEEAHERISAVLTEIEKQVRLPSAAREGFEDALGRGTAVAIVCVRDGILEIEHVEAEWCTPTFDRANPKRVAALEIRYPYVETFFNASSAKYEQRCMLFRRVIDAQRDVTFLPVVASPDGREPSQWVEDPDATVAHELGVCPVIWYRPLAGTKRRQSVDGRPIHWGVLDEIDAYNFALSQRHRAAIAVGDPMMWESGVDPSNPPGGVGRDARAIVEVTPDGRGPHPKGTFRFAPSGFGTTVRRRGAGAIWSSESPDYKVGLLTLPGDALEAITAHATGLKAILERALGVVDLDIENAKIAADMSGKAQQIARQRQVDRDNTYRQDFGDEYLVPLLRMILRVARSVISRGLGVQVEGIEAIRSIDVERLGFDLAWGPYFASTPVDQQATVSLVKDALAAKLVTRRIGIEKLRQDGVFAIDSADAVASEPTLDEELDFKDLAIASPTFNRMRQLRLAAACLGEVDDKVLKAIEKELEAAHQMPVDEHAEPTDTPDESAADAEGTDPADPKAAGPSKAIEVTPSALALVVFANEVREDKGLPAVDQFKGKTLAQIQAENAAITAAAAAAQQGEASAVPKEQSDGAEDVGPPGRREGEAPDPG